MIQANQRHFPSGLRSVLEVAGVRGSPGRERGARTMWLLPALLLLLVPGSFCISGPQSKRGSRGDSLTVQCHYDAGWETYHKWWCRGEAWSSCEILVTTTGSERRVQRGRVAIQDDHGRNAFTVTIEALQESDADAYWCGIQRSGADLGHQVRVSVDPAKPAPAALTSLAPARLGVSPPIVQNSNGSLSLARSLLCNIHFVLLTFLKVPLLVGLLCVVMWLSRQPADAQGKELRLRGKSAAPLPPTPRLERAEPADPFSGNKQGSPFQKRGGSPLGRGPPSSWLQGRSRHSPAPWPPAAQEQRAEQKRCSPYTLGPRRHPQPQPCGSSRGPLSGDCEVALPDVGEDSVESKTPASDRVKIPRQPASTETGLSQKASECVYPGQDAPPHRQGCGGVQWPPSVASDPLEKHPKVDG